MAGTRTLDRERSRGEERSRRDGRRRDPARPRAVVTSPVSSEVAAVQPRARAFLAAIGLSGVLLFTLELLSGRLILPVFGGSPGVWTTALCFFTSVVLLGYVYAHVVATRLSPRRGGTLHLGVAVVAFVLMIAAPRDVASLRNPALPEVVNVLVALAVVAGPAAFLLATTSPLLSAWFARRGGDPWWLYAVSNAASFTGLLMYPFLLEPFLPLSVQRVLLAAGVAALGGALFVVVSSLRRAGTERSDVADVADVADANQTAAVAPPTARRQLRWLFAAFVPAGLLAATTNFLAVDLISAPLIWVGPLAVYLLSFVVAFSKAGRRALPVIDRMAPAAAALLWLPYVQPHAWPFVPLIVVELGSLAILATAIHGRLALDRPAERDLTRFYVTLSAGGMLATAFVAIAAPLLFSTITEYPLLIVAGLAALALLPSPRGPERGLLASLRAPHRELQELGMRLLPYAGVGIVLVALLAMRRPDIVPEAVFLAAVGGVAVAAAVNSRVATVTAGVIVTLLVVSTATEPLLRVRTFFGVVEVRNEGEQRSEYSGTTRHGLQFFDEPRRLAPTLYYTAGGPMGDVFDDLRARVRSGARVGIVGLGVGTALAYAQPGDEWTFYEIDQAIVEIARDDRYFSYLRDAPAPVRIVLGDARLSLAAEPAGTFDVLVLDAFSSDSVPVHLLTREAMLEYHRVLRPGGVVLFHLSNRYYDLIPAVNATARSAKLGVLALAHQPGRASVEQFAATGTSYSLVGDWTSVERFRYRDWSDSKLGPVFTDDFSNLLGTLE